MVHLFSKKIALLYNSTLLQRSDAGNKKLGGSYSRGKVWPKGFRQILRLKKKKKLKDKQTLGSLVGGGGRRKAVVPIT